MQWITPASSDSRIRLSSSITRFLSTTRRRERVMKRFKSPRHFQRFLSTHDQLANLSPAAETTPPPTSGSGRNRGLRHPGRRYRRCDGGMITRIPGIAQLVALSVNL
jgi:hypothetical protein